MTITVLNQKGGVGKTSTCFHLGGELARRGLRVLLIDYDSQGSLTQGFRGPRGFRGLDRRETSWAIAAGESPSPGEVIGATDVPGLDLVAAARDLDGFNLANPRCEDLFVQLRLRDFLAEAVGYDLCLIDCPPNLQLASWQALAAADRLLVPVQPEDFGAQGIGPVLKFGDDAREINPGLRLLGILIGMVNGRSRLHRVFREDMRSLYPGRVLEAEVPRLMDFPEAVSRRMPVAHHAPRKPAAEATTRLADEVLRRLDGGPEFLPFPEIEAESESEVGRGRHE